MTQPFPNQVVGFIPEYLPPWPTPYELARVDNVFCATGEGGGVDPSCSLKKGTDDGNKSGISGVSKQKSEGPINPGILGTGRIGVDGRRVHPGTLPEASSREAVNRVAENYVAQYGDALGISRKKPPTEPVLLDTARSKQIGEVYENLPETTLHEPTTRKAYEKLARETTLQYQHIVKSGMKIDFMTDDPYPSSSAMMKDVAENKHLKVFLTSPESFGSKEVTHNHPLLEGTGIYHNGHELVVNDLFRAVHDYFGHASEGNEFGPVGEERAWAKHSRMFSEEAKQAMTSETRGQNSWVNFGPHMWDHDGWKGDKRHPHYVAPKDRHYAVQKVAILPDSFVANIFCATGEGGGVKATCSPSEKGGSGNKQVDEGKVSSLIKEITGPIKMTQKRAKIGGEIGPNKEFYKGGAFIATTDMPKKVRQKIDQAAKGKVQVDGYTWAVPEPGKMSILDRFGGTMMNPRNGEINYHYLEYSKATPKEVAMYEEITSKWKAGERWIDVHEYPSLSRLKDVARLVVAGKPVPAEAMHAMPEEWQKHLSKYQPTSNEIAVNAFCSTGEGGGVDPTCSPGKGKLDSHPLMKIASEGSREAISLVLANAPAGLIKKALPNVTKIQSYTSPLELSRAVFFKDSEETSGLFAGVSGFLGFVTDNKKPRKGAKTLAHEIGHAADIISKGEDGRHLTFHSDSKAWVDAWQKEIKDTGKLSEYATTDPYEGWAEFARLVVFSPRHLDKFPRCKKIWGDHGLLR